VLADTAITERQKHVLIDVYTSFVKENQRSATNGQASQMSEQESTKKE
jgi:hypothetical protein